MSSNEFSHWLAIDTYIGPIGERRSDYQAAKICSTIAASVGVTSSVEDYLLTFQRQTQTKEVPKSSPQQSTAECEMVINAFFARHKKHYESQCQQSPP